ncbi:MAG: glutamine synthetase adenylyltransferase [Planctomycetaceae bacterium]
MLPPFHNLIESEFAPNCRLMAAAGFARPDAAVKCLMRLRVASDAGRRKPVDSQQRTVPAWFRTLKRILSEAPHPEIVLNTLDQFVRNARPPQNPLLLFERSPRSLDLLSRLACGSPFLTQILLADPAALESLASRQRTADMKPREQFLEEADAAIADQPTLIARLSELRRYQKSELLRIGVCDAFGLLDLKVVTLQISLLADAMVQVCLRLACEQHNVAASPFSVLALGKHGGEELNYSSDIDLVLIGDSDSGTAQKIARSMVDGLAGNLPTGFLYRVDLRLRPWGVAGPLVSTPEAFHRYLLEDAQLWERQALLKARVVAGNPEPGTRLLKTIAPQLFTASPEQVRNSIQTMKERIEIDLQRSGRLNTEVKLGAGSIRDIEFFVQSLQLIHGHRHPELLSPNTLDALVRLTEGGLIDAAVYRQLREGYIFLRAVEHALQLLHNQQTHQLPAQTEQREWLARRLDYPDGTTLLNRFGEHRRAVRSVFENHFQPVDRPENSRPLIRQQPGSPPAATGTELSPEEHGGGQIPAARQALVDRMFADLQQGRRIRVAAVPADADSGEGTTGLVVCCHDVTGLLSMVCGVLFAEAVDIRRGEVCSGVVQSGSGLRIPPERFLAVLQVRLSEKERSGCRKPLAERLESRLSELLIRQQSGEMDGIREELLEAFCGRVRALSSGAATTAAPPAADVKVSMHERQPGGHTIIEIAGHDIFGFLFELSNALAICRFRIRRAEIETNRDQVRDVLHVTEVDGSPVQGPKRLEELRTAVTLIMQFTHWLPSNSDPAFALLKFRDLLQKLLADSDNSDDVASLYQPRVLRAVGRVLGMSRFLWDDFLQGHHSDLFPLLANTDELRRPLSRDMLADELAERLKTSQSPAETLNTFKDRHLFRIDLRHVLGHCRPFGAFSEEVTELAEVVVSAAVTLARDELVARHGTPRTTGGNNCDFCLAALGKFGGVEMGFASDIEVLLIYSEHGRTSGDNSVSAATFFERLMKRVTEIIVARRAGIFQIDLRMRPYGQAGSAAVQLDEFCQYYAPEGDAWPFERQALVKLRCLPAEDRFSQTVADRCAAAIYGFPAFDFDAMRGMRERQTRQLVRGGTVNAKLSEGGLVDLEYAVQALQLTFGRARPELRTSNTLRALQAALTAELISSAEHKAAVDAYVFLRELIDCLRMVRGNALDLTVPAAETSDYRHLIRRMEIVHGTQFTMERLEAQMQAVKRFAATVEHICAAGAAPASDRR